MRSIEVALTPDQLLDGMRQLTDKEKRMLAAAVLADRELEPFVEELEDHLACERAAKDEAEPFTAEELSRL